MSIGIWQIAVVVILVVLLFGRGKISSLMGDVAKGIKSFKKGMASDVYKRQVPIHEPAFFNITGKSFGPRITIAIATTINISNQPIVGM